MGGPADHLVRLPESAWARPCLGAGRPWTPADFTVCATWKAAVWSWRAGQCPQHPQAQALCQKPFTGAFLPGSLLGHCPNLERVTQEGAIFLASCPWQQSCQPPDVDEAVGERHRPQIASAASAVTPALPGSLSLRQDSWVREATPGCTTLESGLPLRACF